MRKLLIGLLALPALACGGGEQPPSEMPVQEKTVVEAYCEDDYTAWQVLVYSDGSTKRQFNTAAC